MIWDGATITEPMQTAQEPSLTPNFYYVFTDTADQGTAVVTFELPCSGTWYVWGYSQCNGGADWAVANTFNAAMDASSEVVWDLAVLPMASDWTWSPGATGGTVWPLTLDAGEHTLTIRGGENDWNMMGNNYPHLGPLVFTVDSTWTPPSK